MAEFGGRFSRWREAAVAHLVFSMRTAVTALRHNTLRAALTSLGIMFGVASVIAMLAIGKGAEQEVLEQMKLLGSNNIVITPLVQQSEEKVEEGDGKREVNRFSPGLTYADAEAIPRVLDAVDGASAELVYNTAFTREGLRRTGKVVGVDTSYFRITNLQLAAGNLFSALQVEHGLPVAIIGHSVRTRFFTSREPVGAQLKIGSMWVTVVGVLADRKVDPSNAQRLGIRDANLDIYVPIRTMLRRIRDRALVTAQDIEMASRANISEGVVFISGGGGNEAPEETPDERAERTNRNQLDRIIVRVADSRLVPSVAEVTQRMLKRRHNDVVDFEITVPELLLKQEQRTRTIFNIVLGAIASISLVVGGIGIMNIMLASVLERIREIGLRRAVGATRNDVLFQFLSEAVLISLAGGLAGILVGGAFSSGIERFAEIHTIVSNTSVIVAFGVSFTVGIVFGIMPAYKAASQDPVTSLRYE
jgi:putative ABC transport system permease protein